MTNWCFVCGKEIHDMGEKQWNVPKKGNAHDKCYFKHIKEKARQDVEKQKSNLFFGVYPNILRHREECPKWGKGFCLDCFGGGLTNFAGYLNIDTSPLRKLECEKKP